MSPRAEVTLECEACKARIQAFKGQDVTHAQCPNKKPGRANLPRYQEVAK